MILAINFSSALMAQSSSLLANGWVIGLALVLTAVVLSLAFFKKYLLKFMPFGSLNQLKGVCKVFSSDQYRKMITEEMTFRIHKVPTLVPAYLLFYTS